MKPQDICSFRCLSEGLDFEKEFEKLKEGKTDEIVLNKFRLIKNKKKKNESTEKFTLQYAPVGNYPSNPIVIICGKTTSGGSHDTFINNLKAGNSFHEACFKSIYSKMKKNLFKYLLAIHLFDYLKLRLPYWSSHHEYSYLWDKLFEDLAKSLSSGIQLTQACNCAILNEDPSKRSRQPPEKIVRKVYNNADCLFHHFRISHSLKLIIFLDTPSPIGNAFHQEEYWNMEFKKKYPHIKYISITHPSGENSDVYNHLPDLSKMTSNKKPNAIKLFNLATEAVSLLRDGEIGNKKYT